MNLLLNPGFWWAALVTSLLMRLPWPARPMQRFGLLNAAALAWLLGWRLALGAGLLTLLAWALLALLQRRPVAGAARARLAAVYLLLAAGLFVLHKLDLEQRGAGGSLLPVELLARLAYSYVFLRLVDAGRCAADGLRLLDPLSLLGYLCPFHMLVAGPVNVYRDHLAADEAAPAPAGFGAVLAGVETVATGLLYKLVLAEGLRIFAFGLHAPLRAGGLADSALLFVYLFFDFAGYSLVALGLGRLMGVPTPVNFDRPLLAPSLTEFWRRWHASLGLWVRTQLYIPLQSTLVRAWGPRRAHAAALLTLVLSFTFVGLWHGLSLPMLLWGVGLGTSLAAEKLVRDRLLRHPWAHRPGPQRLARALGPAYVFVAMVLLLRPVWRVLL